MKDHQQKSFPSKAQACFYVLTFFIGGLIRNTSLMLLLFFFGLAAVAAAINTSKSFWQNPDFRDFVASLEASLTDMGSSTAEINTQPQTHFKDPEKAQRNEIRARRKLVKELRQRKISLGNTREIRHNGRKF